MNTVLFVNATIGFSENLFLVVYENILDKLDIEHSQTKVKVTVRLQIFFTFTPIQTARSQNSTLVQAFLSMYDHLILTYKMYEYRNA